MTQQQVQKWHIIIDTLNHVLNILTFTDLSRQKRRKTSSEFVIVFMNRNTVHSLIRAHLQELRCLVQWSIDHVSKSYSVDAISGRRHSEAIRFVLGIDFVYSFVEKPILLFWRKQFENKARKGSDRVQAMDPEHLRPSSGSLRHQDRWLADWLIGWRAAKINREKEFNLFKNFLKLLETQLEENTGVMPVLK